MKIINNALGCDTVVQNGEEIGRKASKGNIAGKAILGGLSFLGAFFLAKKDKLPENAASAKIAALTAGGKNA
jgi:hypothetical protein